MTGASRCIRVGVVLLSLCAVPPSLVIASGFDDGHKVPATEGARGCSLNVECGHRSRKSSEEYLRYCTSAGRLRFC
jgi:hypothetical protein